MDGPSEVLGAGPYCSPLPRPMPLFGGHLVPIPAEEDGNARTTPEWHTRETTTCSVRRLFTSRADPRVHMVRTNPSISLLQRSRTTV